MKQKMDSPIRIASTLSLFALLTFSSGAIMGRVQNTEQAQAPIINSAVDVQGRLASLAALDYGSSDFRARIADGQLANLYVDLKSQQQWTQSLQPFVSDKASAISAFTQLGKLTDNIQLFYRSYIEQCYLGDREVYDHPDVIVILGANRRTLEQRLAFALPLIQKYRSAPVILSGGGRTIELEADVMRDYLIGKGVDANRLIQETDSLDTVGNAVFTSFALTKHAVRGDKVLLVTSDFHAPRSLFLFDNILDPHYRLAVALAPYDGTDVSTRIDSELQQQATTMRDLLRWGALPGQGSESDLRVNGACSVFFQALLRHKLYASRWDLPRRYAETCNLSG